MSLAAAMSARSALGTVIARSAYERIQKSVNRRFIGESPWVRDAKFFVSLQVSWR